MHSWLVVAILLVSTPAFADWHKLTLPGTKLTVALPDKPTSTTQDVETDAGPTKVTLHTLTVGSMQFIVTANKRLPNAEQATLSQKFDLGEKPFLATQRGKVILHEDTKYRGAPARDLYIADGTNTVRLRQVYVRGTMGMLMMITKRRGKTNDRSDVETAEANKFFASLRF